jgi:hypothetical protein
VRKEDDKSESDICACFRDMTNLTLFTQISEMYVAKWPIMALFFQIAAVIGQSTCEFMRETPLDLDSMPKEPISGK